MFAVSSYAEVKSFYCHRHCPAADASLRILGNVIIGAIQDGHCMCVVKTVRLGCISANEGDESFAYFSLKWCGYVGAGMQPPTVHQAHDQLLTALQDMLSWEARAKTAKELLNDMLKSRREAAELATQYDIR